MYPVINKLRTCSLIIVGLVLTVYALNTHREPWIMSVSVSEKSCVGKNCKYLLVLHGTELLEHASWRITPKEGAKGSECEIFGSDYELLVLEHTRERSKIELVLPHEQAKIFFCLHHTEQKNSPVSGKWIHQGSNVYLNPNNVETSQNVKEDTQETIENNWIDMSHDIDVNNMPQAAMAGSHGSEDASHGSEDASHVNQDASHANQDVSHSIRESRHAHDVEVFVGGRYVPLDSLSDEEVRNVLRDFVSKPEQKYKYIKPIHQNVYKNSALNSLNSDAVSIEVETKKHNENPVLVEDNIGSINLLSKNMYREKRSPNTLTKSKEVLNKVDINNLLETEPHSGMNKVESIENSNLNQEIKLSRDIYSETFNHGVETQSIANINVKNNVIDLVTKKIDSEKQENRKLITKKTATNNTGEDNKTPKGFTSNNTDIKIKKRTIQDEVFDRTNDELISSDDIIKAKAHMENAVPVLKNPEPGMKNNDELISSDDIMKAKAHLENAVPVLKNSEPVVKNEEYGDSLIKIRKQRQARQEVKDFTSVRADIPLVKLEGIRIEESQKDPKIIGEGIPSVMAATSVTLRLFGTGITEKTVIAFTHEKLAYGQQCKFLHEGEYEVKKDSLMTRTALVDITAPAAYGGTEFYVCAKNARLPVDQDQEKYIHQGPESFKILATHNKLLPLWASLVLILTCLMFSALFSGLNLGLMSLDRTELKIIANTGTEKERRYAKAIMPVRDHGNYLLCSILLGNVAVNSTFTILLDDLTSGLFAVIFSTLLIVLFGEITPQAFCSRYGLMVGAKTIMVTKAVMCLTAPIGYPVSKLLDYFLGEEIGSVYNRERLKELVKVTTDVNDLDKDEVNIISGALEMRKKTVKDIMTKLEDVFMLPITSVLDFETMSEIVKSGYSRIPVYEGHRGNIVTVLFIKDLAFVDPDDNTPLRTLCQYYQNPCNFVFEDVTLDVMFRQFKEGAKGHMAFVHRINTEGEGDPFYETIGLVTLEDVIEEMIQAEIVDETDVFLDNRSKRRRRHPTHKLNDFTAFAQRHENQRIHISPQLTLATFQFLSSMDNRLKRQRRHPTHKLSDFTAFAQRHENQRIHISPQLTLATFQFLSSSVEAFRPDTVSESVLRRLLKQDVIQYIKLKGKTKKDSSTYIYHQGKPVDYFVLILEGRVEVTVGRENLVFEAGPFTYFGVQALTQNVNVAESPTPSVQGSLQNINMESMLRHTFVPDYSVRAISDTYYLTVKRTLYLAAKRATLMEKGQSVEQFDTEVDKLCDSTYHIPLKMISKKLLGPQASGSMPRIPRDSLDNPRVHNSSEFTPNRTPTRGSRDDDNEAGPSTSSGKLLQAVDEDASLNGENKTPSRQVSPNPGAVAASPIARGSFAAARTPDRDRDPNYQDEQEKLLKSP